MFNTQGSNLFYGTFHRLSSSNLATGFSIVNYYENVVSLIIKMQKYKNQTKTTQKRKQIIL